MRIFIKESYSDAVLGSFKGGATVEVADYAGNWLCMHNLATAVTSVSALQPAVEPIVVEQPNKRSKRN